jgi:hypothetical protein
MRKIHVGIWCALLLSGANNAYSLDKNGNFESKLERDEFIALQLKNMAREINSQTPIQLDEDTRLTSVLALRNTITFNYLLPRVGSKDISPEFLEREARGNLNHTVCKSKATRDLIDSGVEYSYIYSGNDGRQITRVTIRSYRCK